MPKLFSHRGFTKHSEENTIASLKEAYQNGFRAIEFDIWLVDGDLFIKHDEPKKEELADLPKLRDYLIYGNEMSYWMDFKNMNMGNVDTIAMLVKEAISQSKIEMRQIYLAPYVVDDEALTKFFHHKMKEILNEKIHYAAVCEKLKDVQKLKRFLHDNKIDYLSIAHEEIDENMMNIFQNIKVVAWTVNDLNRVKELYKMGVENVITDDVLPEAILNQN